MIDNMHSCSGTIQHAIAFRTRMRLASTPISRLPHPMNRNTSSIAERLHVGLIASVFGVMVGVFATLVLLGMFAMLGFPHPFNPWMVAYSAGFFFVIGLFRGMESTDTIADVIGAAFVGAFAALGLGGSGATSVDGTPQWRASMWYAIAYFSGLALVVWLT